MEHLKDFELKVLRTIHFSETKLRTPYGVYKLLNAADPNISMELVTETIFHLIKEGYIVQVLETTPLAERELGTEK